MCCFSANLDCATREFGFPLRLRTDIPSVRSLVVRAMGDKKEKPAKPGTKKK